jgi:hypothetical protein
MVPLPSPWFHTEIIRGPWGSSIIYIFNLCQNGWLELGQDEVKESWSCLLDALLFSPLFSLFVKYTTRRQLFRRTERLQTKLADILNYLHLQIHCTINKLLANTVRTGFIEIIQQIRRWCKRYACWMCMAVGRHRRICAHASLNPTSAKKFGATGIGESGQVICAAGHVRRR